MSKLKTLEARLNILIRLIGLIFLILGVIVAYFTSSTPLIPQLAPVFYLISILLMISGILALVSKFN